MSDEASPRPWRAEPMGRVGMDCLIDAEGQYIATVGKTNSALIVNTVNFYKEIAERNLLNAEKVCELFDKIGLLEDENKRMREVFGLLLPALESGDAEALRYATLVVRGWAQKGDAK